MISFVQERWALMKLTKLSLTMALSLTAISLHIASATSGEITRSVPASATIRVVPFGHQDLTAIAARLNTRTTVPIPEDVDGNGVVDLLDLTIVARWLGLEVTP